MSETAGGGVEIQTEGDAGARIEGDVAGRDIKTTHHLTPELSSLYKAARQGEIAALAELLRMVINRQSTLEAQTRQNGELLAGLIDAMRLSSEQGAATRTAIDLLRREVKLKEAVEQQMKALQQLAK